MRRVGLVAAWVALAAVATTATWQVVGAAEDRVAVGPVAPVVALTLPREPSVPSETTSADDPGAITTRATAPTTAGTSRTTAAPPPTQATTPSTTATTAPATTAAPRSGSATIPSPAGTVVVSFSGSQVFLDAATPAIGFTADVEDAGPDQVTVEFEAAEVDVTVRARMENGRLVTEVSVDDDSDDDGGGGGD